MLRCCPVQVAVLDPELAKQLRFGKDLLDVTTSPNVPGHSEG